MKRVDSVSTFINKINDSLKELRKGTDSNLFCYRGEQRNYGETSGMPNIFRGKDLINLNESRNYEKNVLDEVIINDLSNHENYLQAAINAQHGGFPSRLLDVTFNSLIGLFFAVTPHFSKEVTAHDDKDGIVIVYAIDKLYSSNSKSIQNHFEDIISPNEEGEKKKNERIEGYIHRLIDFTNLNSRIKAQQGGLILFSGDQFIPVPSWKEKRIIIPGEKKADIREELKTFFGMTIGTIYPESDNLVAYLTEKAKLLTEENFKDDLIYELKKQLDYYYYKFLKVKFYKAENLLQLLYEIEEYLYLYVESVFESEKLSEDLEDDLLSIIDNFCATISTKLPKDYSFVDYENLTKGRNMINE